MISYKQIFIYLKFINDNFNIQVPVGFLLFCLFIHMFWLSRLDGFCLIYLVFSVETLQDVGGSLLPAVSHIYPSGHQEALELHHCWGSIAANIRFKGEFSSPF